MTPVGNSWLREHFNRKDLVLPHESFLGRSASSTHHPDGRITSVYPARYALRSASDPLAHIEFGLKYDGVDLQLLHAVFLPLPAAEVERFIAESPTGIYARQIGFLYEMLTGRTLAVSRIGGNYVPVLDPERYITAPVRKVSRWRIDDNLLGTAGFNPVVRLTPEIRAGLLRDWSAEISAVLADTPTDLLHRALTWLYAKETRSSYLIEREEPGRDREQRFIATLRSAGKVPVAEAMTSARLVSVQNTIVDARYAEAAFRQNQNYVGETLPGAREHVHYISPPPDLVPPLMAALVEAAVRTEAVPAVIQAAVTGFQFVFIHPFEDGNGRLHRFLFQDVLARRGLIPSGAALPLSAAILGDLPAYDRALESFSQGIMARARYTLTDHSVLTLQNPAELEPRWRFPDLTPQTEFLFRVMARSITELPKELAFLERYDRARAAIRAVVDMPDQRLASVLHWLHEGKGRLSNNKRKHYAELSDEEVTRVEAAYAEAYAAGT